MTTLPPEAAKRMERLNRHTVAIGQCTQDAQTGLYYSDRLAARRDIRAKINELRALEDEQEQLQQKILGMRAELEALQASQNGHPDPEVTNMLQALHETLERCETRGIELAYRLGALPVLVSRLADTGTVEKVDRVKTRQQIVKQCDWEEKCALQRLNNASERLASVRRDSPPTSDAVRKAEREVAKEKTALVDIQTRRVGAQDEIATLRAEMIEED